MNNQLLMSRKHSFTWSHFQVEFTIPALVLRINSIVCTFSSIDNHFASTGVFGKKNIKGKNIANVTIAQMICSHFHDAMPPISDPALSSLMSL